MDSKEYEGLSKNQAAKFRAYYENEYKSLFPFPEMKIVGLDWKFYWSIVVSAATVILASLRTAQMFYLAAETSAKSWGMDTNSLSTLSKGDALASMIAVEVGLVVISALKSVEKKNIPDWIYNAQIALLLLISVVAGLGQSVGLIHGISQDLLRIFSYILVLVLGVGASFAAWFSGEILGLQLQKYANLKLEASEKWEEHKRIHLQNGRKKFLEKSEKSENSQKSSPEVLPPSEKSEKFSRSSPKKVGNSEKVSLIFAEMDKHYSETSGELLNFSTLASVLREKYPDKNFSSDGYISTVRKNWVMNKQIDSESKDGI